VDASADGHHLGELFRGEFVEQIGIWRIRRCGEGLAGKAAGPTYFLSGSSGGAALLVGEFSGLALGLAALFAEFA
jgi:hypothetical protein